MSYTEKTEASEQIMLFNWAEMASGAHPELGLMHHIPNEGKRPPKTGAHLKAQGLKKGFPDICLPVARNGYHGLYIELKKDRSSTFSKEQEWWIHALNEQGYLAEICYGFDEAQRLVEWYIRKR